MRKLLSALVSTTLIASFACITVYGAGYDTPPQLTISTASEIEGSTYSTLGRWESGLSKYIAYDDRRYTQYPEAMLGSQQGVPIVITVDDPDSGQLLTGKVQANSNSYDIRWKIPSGKLGAPTGSQAIGYAFIPLAKLANGNMQIKVSVSNYENQGDSSPITTVTDTVGFKVDLTPPIVSVARKDNKLTVNTCSELPSRLMVQHKDGMGQWLPPETFRITSVPSSYTYDSLTLEGSQVQFWVEDMVGNRTSTESGSLGTPANKVTYTGFSEENRSCYASFIGTRLGEEAKTVQDYFDFLKEL